MLLDLWVRIWTACTTTWFLPAPAVAHHHHAFAAFRVSTCTCTHHTCAAAWAGNCCATPPPPLPTADADRAYYSHTLDTDLRHLHTHTYAGHGQQTPHRTGQRAFLPDLLGRLPHFTCTTWFTAMVVSTTCLHYLRLHLPATTAIYLRCTTSTTGTTDAIRFLPPML